MRSRSCRAPAEVQVPGDPPAVPGERLQVQADPLPGLVQIMIVQVDVEQIDEPRWLDVGPDTGVDDGAGDRQGRGLRDVVNVAVPRPAQLVVFLGEQPLEEVGGERLAGRGAVPGQAGPLLGPFPHVAWADLARVDLRLLAATSRLVT